MSDYVGVTLKELDYSTSVQTASASGAGFAGSYAWGPIMDAQTITDTDNYALIFGKPTKTNKIPYFTAWQYLGYSDNLRVVRVAGEGTKNSTSVNYDYTAFNVKDVIGTFEVGSTVEGENSKATAVVVSMVGNVLKVYHETGLFAANEKLTATNNATCTIESINSKQYRKIAISSVNGKFEVAETITGDQSNATGVIVQVLEDSLIYKMDANDFIAGETITGGTSAATAVVAKVADFVDYGPSGLLIKNGNVFDNMVVPFKFAARYAGEYGNSIIVSACDSNSFSKWKYAGLFDGAPEEGEIHLVVVDKDGTFFNSYAGNILSTYSYLSLAKGTKNDQGQDSYYKTVLNNQDGYVYAGDLDLEAIDLVNDIELTGGTLVEPTDGDLQAGYGVFSDQEREQSLYVFGANYSQAVTNNIIAMVDKRQDLMAIFSPNQLSILQQANKNDIVTSLNTWGDGITFSNRVILDSNWMYVYNTFDDEYLWVPMAGATAGVNSRCDTNNNYWDSPMGFTRGSYQNVTRLAWQPDKEDRIAIYARSINPIYVSNQAGVVLMGDRTHVIKPSYFRQIAARKTLIVIERGAASYLMYYLGENNNTQTRALVTSNLSQWLRTLGAAGAFRLAQVVCNEKNNTQQIIDEQKMRVLIRLLLQSSINTIELQVAVVNNVATFTENVIQGIF